VKLPLNMDERIRTARSAPTTSDTAQVDGSWAASVCERFSARPHPLANSP
jgi:hypothetical protein